MQSLDRLADRIRTRNDEMDHTLGHERAVRPLPARGGPLTDIRIIDLTAELAKLTMLRGRTPTTTRAEREGSSTRLTPYRDGAIFASKSAGKGAWECHLDGDELEQVIEGSATLDIVTEDNPVQSIPVHAGMIAIVPRGIASITPTELPS